MTKTLIAAAAFLLTVGAAQARLIVIEEGGPENTRVVRSADDRGNIVGGGFATLSGPMSNERITYSGGPVLPRAMPPMGGDYANDQSR